MSLRPSRPLRLMSRRSPGWRAWLAPCVIACLVVGAALLPVAPVMALPPPVNVTLEPRQIALGETAQLTITSTGSGMDAVTLPVVAGLEFRVVGQSRRRLEQQ
jgi:hypothetical protein